MQDLKTGYLCHVSPRAQFYSQLIGSVMSIIFTTVAYTLYVQAFKIPGPSFPAPSAYVWLSFARLLRKPCCIYLSYLTQVNTVSSR